MLNYFFGNKLTPTELMHCRLVMQTPKAIITCWRVRLTTVLSLAAGIKEQLRTRAQRLDPQKWPAKIVMVDVRSHGTQDLNDIDILGRIW